MNLVLMAEGARIEMGGVGLVAVPPIGQALARLGHRVTVEIFGPVIPGAEEFATTNPDAAFQENLAAILYPARGRYALSLAAVPHVWKHVRRADFVMLHSLYSFAVLTGYCAARVQGKKYGLWPHGVLAPFQRTVSPGRKALYDRFLTNRILNQASVIFYNALGERAEAASLQLQAPSVIIPHGIDTEPFAHLPARGAFRLKYFPGFEGPLVLYLGRLNAKKGLEILVQTMQQLRVKLPTARLAIVGAGDPPEFAVQLAGRIRDAGLTDCIAMPGLLMGDAKLAALADADIFVLPSRQENFSFAMFEAMASKIPVVVSDTLNFAPEVERFRAGLVVARNADAFADALVELSASRAMRQQLGEGGARLAERYTWSAVGKQMERVIEAIVSNQALPRDLVLGQALS